MSEVLCRCPSCSAKFKVDAKYAGKKARCPKCSVVVEVPAAGSDSTGSTPPAAGAAPVATPVAPAAPVAPKAAPVAQPVGVPIGHPVQKAVPGARPLPPRPTPPAPMPAREQAVNALVEEPVTPELVDEQPASQSSSSGFDFQLKIKKPKSSSPNAAVVSSGPTTTHDPAAMHHGKPAKDNTLPIILAAVAGLVLLAGIGGAALVFSGMLSNDGTQVAKSENKSGSGGQAATAKGTGKLVLDWSEEDRKNGFAVLVDGKRELALTKGELSFDLKPGDRKIIMQRRGYEQVETTVNITVGEVVTYKPVWKKNEFGSTGPAVATSSNGNSGGTDFQIGLGAGSPVKGFEGFTQNFHLAKETAAKAQKNILLIFGSSDFDQQTMQLGRATQAPGAKDEILASFVPVMIDNPRTREGYNNLYDSAQNDALRQEFVVGRKSPVLYLLDQKGKSYYKQDDWKQGTSDLKAYLTEGAAARAERDEMWSAVKGETLEPAVKFLTWLIDKELVFRYGEEVQQWKPVAQRLDPTNEKGQLECFVEAEMMSKVPDITPGDEIEARQFASLLQDWVTNKRFKNEDRGARCHMMVATLLGISDQRQEAMKHLSRATTYTPTDADLKKKLAEAKTFLERGNILSTGTGFFVTADGYLLTNHHVIEGRGKVVVRLPDNKTTVEGKVIAKDEERDMALVKIDIPAGLSIKTVAVAPSNIGRGIDVAAFGYPLAGGVEASLKLTTGGVSALPDDSNDQMIMLDLRVNPGNSGGPLCDQKGNVVGMVTAKTRTNMFTNEDSYGMAIPSPDLAKFLDQNLPAGSTRPQPNAPPQRLEWSDVDAQVSPGVLLILKME